MKTLKNIKLQYRITIFTLTLILFIIILTSLLFYKIFSESFEQELGEDALHVATTVASMPEIRNAFETDEPWKIIQPVVEKIRIETDAEYIVVGNNEGIRYSHPIPERIGKRMVGGDNDKALIYGESYISKAKGSLGWAIRGKAPIKDDNNNIIGIVSVGFMMNDIKNDVKGYVPFIILIALAGLIIGTVGSIYIANRIKKGMFGLEPEEISALYTVRNAVIQSVREGIIVVNKEGIIVIVNRVAYDILSLEKGKVVGKPVWEVIPTTAMLEILSTGEEKLDKQVEFNGKKLIVNQLPVKVKEDVIGIVSSFRLKSEMDQLTEELSQVKRYTEALRAQTHEFNNLLYTISGLLQLEAYDEAMELIHKETTVQQGIAKFIMEKLNDPWLGGILVGFYNRARELKVDFILDQESSIEQMPSHIDQSDLVSILGNLITNAFEAVAKNGPTNKKVRLFITDIGDDLLIEVEDSGPGIEDYMISSIFKRGFSTKEGGNRGYGLARVKELVEDLNGTLAIERGDWEGALFIIAIPKERLE
ncbi:sensor histidine kinase [Schinkia azotoformans]|uniref:histidine kinase n=1 Tax=Schinkia azotoformans LMG 9581 TaxID=1131731 RepID=K6D5U7_SCHAZ|nr:sensor histidine kinase [Schinkia azotoformans]EKN67897.1 sensor histidine kinase [Schinkia azotoformans LMG 9581]MEC1637083.1 sensor histidine kinase [Schinkia azotoformans]MEC1945472.1 sensor histidine kinase [Schinkia azotoformans]